EAARRLELATPRGLNVVVTAEELLRHPSRASDYVRARVVRDAIAASEAVGPAEAVPLRRPVTAFALLLLAWAAAAVWVPQLTRADRREADARLAASQAGPVIPRVTATLTPPAYLNAPESRRQDPERIEAIAGTRLVVAVAGGDSAWRVRLGSD